MCDAFARRRLERVGGHVVRSKQLWEHKRWTRGEWSPRDYMQQCDEEIHGKPMQSLWFAVHDEYTRRIFWRIYRSLALKSPSNSRRKAHRIHLAPRVGLRILAMHPQITAMGCGVPCSWVFRHQWADTQRISTARLSIMRWALLLNDQKNYKLNWMLHDMMTFRHLQGDKHGYYIIPGFCMILHRLSSPICLVW